MWCITASCPHALLTPVPVGRVCGFMNPPLLLRRLLRGPPCFYVDRPLFIHSMPFGTGSRYDRTARTIRTYIDAFPLPRLLCFALDFHFILGCRAASFGTLSPPSVMYTSSSCLPSPRPKPKLPVYVAGKNHPPMALRLLGLPLKIPLRGFPALHLPHHQSALRRLL